MDIFFSNRIEKLYEQLKVSLFSKFGENPFERRLIIVPSPAIKSWLMLKMAKDPCLNIAMGVEISLLDQAIEKLIIKQKLPSIFELQAVIEIELKKIVKKNDPNKWPELFNYLKISQANPSINSQSEKRLISLSQKLSTLFFQYGTYGGKMLGSFEENIDDFQIEIWKQIFSTRGWPYLQKELQENNFHETSKNAPIFRIHLFSLSFLSKVHYDFLLNVSRKIPVFYYFLSPCQAFWSDIKSDREQIKLQKYLQKNSSTSAPPIDEYLRDQNPLLANFGKLGAEMSKLIELSEAETDSCYLISEAVAEIPQYEEFIFDTLDGETGSFNLLKAIQADLTVLRNPALDKKIELEKDDDSIQIHIAASRSREIQILYDTLLNLIKKNEDHLVVTPGDIIVMAPDIMDYEPFIHSVFGSDESLLPFHVLDLHMPSQNKLVQGFNHLLALPKNRFSADSLMDLFNGEHFRTCHHLSLEDVDQIRQWLVNADLRWGLNLENRDELLKLEHCKENIADDNETGTFAFCLDRLLTALAVGTLNFDTLNSQLERLPIQGVESSDSLLLGKFASLIQSIHDDLKILSDGSEMTLKNWASYLDCLATAYFGIDETNDHLTKDELMLLKFFDEFRKSSEKFKTDLFSFNTIKSQLESAFKKETLDFQETQLNSVRFCSMLPMRAIPADVIVLIGMNEGAFPRSDTKNSLNLCTKYPDSDYSPTKTDYDRYLFLEALLSARHYFILSYVGYSLAEAKETSGSLVVTELIEVIDSGYLIGDAKFSEVRVKRHPFNAYDRNYFEKNSGFISYSSFNYHVALKFYETEKLKKYQFIDNFKPTELKTLEIPDLVLDLKDLSNFARNPLKVYFNQTLGVYLKNHDPEFKTDEDFSISHLNLAIIKKSALKQPLKQVFNLIEKKGMLPSGLFKQVAINKIETDVSSLINNLKNLDVITEDLFNIDFFENCKTAFRAENGDFQLPPLEINYQGRLSIKIVGTLQDVSLKGLIIHAKDSKVDIIKFWPQFLVFTALMNEHQIAEKQLIFAKCGKTKLYDFEDPMILLKEYLTYYFKGLENPSPLIPEWVYDFVYNENNSLNIKINQSLNDDFNPLYNEYLHWLRNGSEIPLCESFKQEWKSTAQKLFLDLYEKWYKK